MPTLKNIVKPSDFGTSRLCGSNLQKCEKEIVARNIIVISELNGDQWFPFSFEDYKQHCKRDDYSGEEAILDDLVNEDQILDKKKGAYSEMKHFLDV